MLLILFVLLVLYWVGRFIYDYGYSNGYERGLINGVNYTKKDLDNVFIVDGVCRKAGKTICNLGYACDACPYNKDVKK